MTKREIKCVLRKINQNLFYEWNPMMLNPYRDTNAMNSEIAKVCHCAVDVVRDIKKLL